MSNVVMEELQKKICTSNGAEFKSSPPHMKVGISLNVQNGVLPINGLRHPPQADTTGWYIYAGEELPDEADFFKPLHVEHLKEWCPDIEKFLGLAPGWRFLVAGDYVDVWFDPTLLEV